METTKITIIAFLFIAVCFLTGCTQQATESNIINFDKELAQGSHIGCGNFSIRVNNESWNNFLIIEGVTVELLPDTSTYTYEITKNPDLEIYIDEYHLIDDGTEYAGCFRYCNDVLCSSVAKLDSINKWTPQSGIVELKRTSIDSTGFFPNYRIDFLLKDAEFIFENNVRIINTLGIEQIRVGWLPG